MEELMGYLDRVADESASDMFIVPGGHVSMKQAADWVALSEKRVFAQETQRLIMDLYALADRKIEPFLERGDDDFSLSTKKARFRVSAYRQRGSLAAVLRVVPYDIPTPESMHIPEEIMKLAGRTKKMVLITGVAGSGKSTTQACIINKINHERSCHIITLEDPIEYIHRDDKSIISQREIGIDTKDYLSALRACLRQAPDVILLGEMRDQETIRTAMTAAETGHLVIATLHTEDAKNTIDRIIDTFPAEQQRQVRIQLTTVLDTVVSQALLPDMDGGMVPAFEIMHMTNAIKNMIREEKPEQIPTAIASGDEGMVTMEQSIKKLCDEGRVSRDTARRCFTEEKMPRWLKR